MILLHQVQDGAASKSHGLQVAKLAGIPAPVIKEARGRLRALERQQALHLGQNDLFDQIEEPFIAYEKNEDLNQQKDISPENTQVLDQIDALNVDNLTPKQALDILYQLKELVSTAKKD